MEESSQAHTLNTKGVPYEALVDGPMRLALVAVDLVAVGLVAHLETGLEAMGGKAVEVKAMVVCRRRRIYVELPHALIQLRPAWATGTLKVVMTGNADDGPDGQPHIRSKDARRQLAHRFKDSAAPFQIEIVRDIWRTGFEALCLHTMDADEPMQGHSLMQVFAVMLETHGIAAELPHGFGWSAAICSSPRCGASSTGTWPPSGSKGS